MSEPQNGRGALFAGGLAAILASTCCLGPLVLVALGFSGAWIGNLTVLEPYRPLFIGAALVALFFAWKRIYRPVQACKPGEVCAIPQVRATYKLIFWIVAVLVLVGHCCKVSDEAAFCLIQRPYISKTLLTRRISPRGSP